jgi:uncharacterized membrane protein YraQ (UPF0718 family)
MARGAGRLVGRWLPVAKSAVNTAKSEASKLSGEAKQRSSKAASDLGAQWIPAARTSGRFVKHVLPAAVKPLHALWHQVLGFIFLAIAALGAFKVWRNEGHIAPAIFALAIVLIVVAAAYGISSIRKSQRISRS